MRMKSFFRSRLSDKKIKNVIFLFYVLFGLILLYFHEPWRDEANTWLIARNLSFFEILEEVRVDGNPCLYYLFLYPFAKLGLPYIFNNIISFSISIITIYLFVYKINMSNLLKFLFSFSSLFIYYGGIFGRSYCIVNLLFVLVTILYKRRFIHFYLYSFLIALLLNTHVMMLGFCFCVFVISIYDWLKNKKDNKRMLFGIFIQLFGFFLLFFQLYGGISGNGSVSIVTLPFVYLISFIFLIFLLSIIVIKYKNRYIFICLFSFLFQISGVLFVPHVSRYIINLFYLNLLFLLNYYMFDIKFKCIIYVLLFYFFIISVPIYYDDLRYVFSDGKNVSNYIYNHVDKKDKVLCVPDYLCTSVVVYLPEYQLYDVFGQVIRYMDYSNYRKDFFIDIDEVLNNHLYDFVIIGDDYKKISDDRYVMVYYSMNKLVQYDEKYYVFKRR